MLRRSKNNTLRVVALSTVVAFAAVKGTPLCAQTSSAPAKSGNSALLQNLKGVDITKENMYKYVTTGNPGDLSLTMSDNEASKVFVLYNKGTGKFLNVGGYWGSSAVLSNVPCPLWLQIRNDKKSKVRQSSTIYEHYPMSEGEVITATRTNNQTNWIKKYNEFKTYVNGNEGKLYIGSEQGDTRTRAIYNKVQILKSDGTLKSTLRFESTGDKATNAGTGSTSATETVTGDGTSHFISSTSLSNLNLTDGDVLEAHLNLAPCTSDLENVFSIGTNISVWKGTGIYNLHIYYTPSTRILLLRGCFNNDQKSNMSSNTGDESYNTEEEFVINNPADVVFKLTKDGFYVNNVMMPRYYSYTIPYVAGKEGQIAKFKYEGGHYVTDENGTLTLDDNGQPYRFDVFNTDNYIYADAPGDKEPSLFFSRRLNHNSATSTDNEGNFIGWVPANGNAAAYDKLSDVYTDRPIPGADNRYKPEQERWKLIATGANGEYKLALDMTAKLENGSIKPENGATTGRFYLTASTSIVKGPSKYYFKDGAYIKPTEADKQHCYYSTLNADGTRTYTEKYSDDLTNVIMTADDSTDDNCLWRIVSVKDYIQLLKQQKSLLRDAVDLTALLADPNFTRKDLDLKDWKLTEHLQSNDNSYHKALVRIGYDGSYKTKPEDDKYLHGASYNFYDNTDRGNDSETQNNFVANHSRYMCATIQNGGYGQMYQTVQITRNGWYIVRCQGLSTVNARLFARVVGKNYYSPLRKITDEYYCKNLQIMDAKDAYWPYDQCMPMYNAAVEMSDEHAQPNKVEESTTQVLFYVDEASNEEPITVTFGIDVPQTTSKKLTNGSATYSSDFTAFDNFRLLYGGEEASEPYLVLDEDDETLDHLDNTIHHYRTDTETGVNKKLLLHRTFTQGKWNSFMLPVGLTEAQFKGAFGDDAQLAELTTLTENEIHFKTVTAESTYGNGNLDATKYWLKPMTAYIIKIADASKTQGNVTDIYDAYLYHWADNGKTFTKKTIGGADNSYYSIEGISMIEGIAPVTEDDNFTHWDFKNKLTISDGANGQYHYVATSKAANYSDGTMTPYGMFTRNYGVNADGTKHLLEGRAPMSDAYILSGGKLKYTAGGGASKGFRCWFQFTKEAQAGAAPMLYIDGIGDPTGIEGIRANDGNGTLTGRYAQGVFTINGQRVADASALSSLPHGVYIVNGKKVVK